MEALELTVWHWVIIGVVLLIFETLGAAGLTLGVSLAAFVVAALMGVGLLAAWQAQLLVFAVLSVMLTAMVWYFFRRKRSEPEAVILDDLAARLVGRRVELQQDLPTGQGKIQIGDTLWAVEADSALQQGQIIEVTGYQGSILTVKTL